MAYAQQGLGRKRATAAVAVATIQAGVLYALISGLAVHFIPHNEAPNPKAADNPIEVPITPPEVTPTEEIKNVPPITPLDKPIDRPLPPPIGDPTTMPTDVFTHSGGTGMDGGNLGNSGGPIVDPVPPEPTPSASPTGAVPRGNPASWFTTSDYPGRRLREGNEGLTRFRLTIGIDGKATGCEVIASSGSASLDNAACSVAQRKARFAPATDGYGSKTIGTYSGSVRWQIPKD